MHAASGCFPQIGNIEEFQHAEWNRLRGAPVISRKLEAVSRCTHCHQGQSPRDAELDVEGTAFSPGIRRMMAVVGSETSFGHGREQLELLAVLQVTTKSIERQAEFIGADIAQQARDKAARFPRCISKWMAHRCRWYAKNWKAVWAESKDSGAYARSQAGLCLYTNRHR